MTDDERQLLFRYYERDDRKVAKMIREGKTDFITGTGWALLDKFFIFLEEIGFYRVLKKVEGEGYERVHNKRDAFHNKGSDKHECG